MTIGRAAITGLLLVMSVGALGLTIGLYIVSVVDSIGPIAGSLQ